MTLVESTSKELVTIQSYDRTARDWSNQHQDSYSAKEFAMFKHLLPSGLILEVGCGPGRDARWLAKMGYTYKGVDVSSGLIEVAKQDNPTLNFQHIETATNLPFIANMFDGFWSHATFLHIGAENLQPSLYEVRRVLRSKGVAFISVKQGAEKDVYQEDTYGAVTVGRYFNYYQETEFGEELEKSGLGVRQIMHHEIGHTHWLEYFVEANK